VNEYFYWDAQIDGQTGALKNIFWSYANQCAECRDFGDIIIFDTMHKTNKHRMPLTMFVGSNHHLIHSNGCLEPLRPAWANVGHMFC
jgi:hypothetical protein